MVPEVRTEMKKENFGFFLSKNIKKNMFCRSKISRNFKDFYKSFTNYFLFNFSTFRMQIRIRIIVFAGSKLRRKPPDNSWNP